MEGDADRGGVASGKEEHPRGQKKAALLTELNASRSSFARAGPAPRDRVRATFDLDDATKSKLWEGR